MAKNLTLKEQEDLANMEIWKAIDENREINFLDLAHQLYFREHLGEFYLNYTLDAFSEYKILSNSIEEAKFKSIWAGITKMTFDYLFGNMINEVRKNKKSIDGKFGWI